VSEDEVEGGAVAEREVVRGGMRGLWRVAVLCGEGSSTFVGMKDVMTRSIAEFISSRRESVAGVESKWSFREGIVGRSGR
jgi:hypothetical protein